MSLRLKETETGFVCEHNNRAVTMLASVVYVRDCEQCIRQAFAEALERTLRENGFKTNV